jgi:hypothetical protein
MHLDNQQEPRNRTPNEVGKFYSEDPAKFSLLYTMANQLNIIRRILLVSSEIYSSLFSKPPPTS